MKISISLAVISMVLFAGAAAFAAPPAGLAAPTLSPLCGGRAPMLAAVTLPERTAVPPPIALGLACGVCSASACVGAHDGSVCSGGTQPLHCYIESTCTQGGQSCICASEPF